MDTIQIPYKEYERISRIQGVVLVNDVFGNHYIIFGSVALLCCITKEDTADGYEDS